MCLELSRAIAGALYVVLLVSFRYTALITTDNADHGLVDGNGGSDAVAAKMGELDGLEAHGYFLIYNWPEKAL